MDITIEIIEFIRANRVSTTEVADALGKSGVLADILPITPGKLHVGRVRALFTANDSNYDLHEQCKHVEKGEVVIVFTIPIDPTIIEIAAIITIKICIPVII